MKLFSSLCYFPEPLFVSQSSWPWTSFCFRGFWFMSLNRVLCPQVPCLFPWVPYSFPRALYWAAGALRVPCSLPWIHDVLPCMLHLDYCAHFAVYFLAFLLLPVLLICFLHRSFISGNSWFISLNRYFIVSVFHIDFPEFFSFPYPRASFKVLNFSAYFPEFRRLLYFLVYFDRFVFICLFLWILICFSESEPLVFSSLAKTHQVVKLKRRPQWWQNAFVGYVNWREALKHIHYLLAIIESSIFVRSLVASLVVSHHWRRRCHLITYCSSASCCKEVRSPCFLFTLHGHIVKLVTASNFTRILTNENVSPDSKDGDISRAVAAITNLPSSTLPDSPFIRVLGTPAAQNAPPQTGTLAQRALEEWERTLCENKAVAILAQMQAGRPALIQKDGGEMLIAIVLDRPLADAKALVDDPAAFTREMTRILLEKQNHPLIVQMIKPAGSGDPPPSNSAASSTGSHEHPRASVLWVCVSWQT